MCAWRRFEFVLNVEGAFLMTTSQGVAFDRKHMFRCLLESRSNLYGVEKEMLNNSDDLTHHSSLSASSPE